MDLLMILIIIIAVFLIIEFSKHFLFTTTAKFILIILIISIVFLIVLGSLKSENLIKTDNAFINTGASIVDSIQEKDIFKTISEGINDLKEDIFNK